MLHNKEVSDSLGDLVTTLLARRVEDRPRLLKNLSGTNLSKILQSMPEDEGRLTLAAMVAYTWDPGTKVNRTLNSIWQCRACKMKRPFSQLEHRIETGPSPIDFIDSHKSEPVFAGPTCPECGDLCLEV